MIKLSHAITSHDISQILHLPLDGASDAVIDNIGSQGDYNERSVVFSQNASSEITCGCLLARDAGAKSLSSIIHPTPQAIFGKLIEALNLPPRDSLHRGIHPSALVSQGAVLGENVTVGPFSVIDDGVVIGENSIIGSHCHIMQHVRMGSACHIGHHTTIYPKVSIGGYVKIGAQCVLGDEGFGYDWADTHWALTPQIADLIIEDHVTLGPMSVVDRGALENTIIAHGTTLDAHMMIGHGVKLDKFVIMAARAAIGGSSHIGPFTIAGGCVSIADHINVTGKTRLAGHCNVGRDIKSPGDYASQLPAVTAQKWRKWFRHMLRITQDDAPASEEM